MKSPKKKTPEPEMRAEYDFSKAVRGKYAKRFSEGCNMSIPNTRERKVRPTHPGEMLREDYLPDYGLTISTFAKALGVSRQTVNELLRERRSVSPEMALRLSRLFGNTAEFWLNVQRTVDLWEASRTIRDKIKHISPLSAA